MFGSGARESGLSGIEQHKCMAKQLPPSHALDMIRVPGQLAVLLCVLAGSYLLCQGPPQLASVSLICNECVARMVQPGAIGKQHRPTPNLQQAMGGRCTFQELLWSAQRLQHILAAGPSQHQHAAVR